MRPFRFCMSCGSTLKKGDDGEGYECAACGRVWYRTSNPTAGAAIVDGGRALVTQRAREPRKGAFDVPGGFLRAGEDPIDGLQREVREELGLEIETDVGRCLSMVCHTYGDEGEFVLALGFHATLVAGEPTPADDVAAFRWVTNEDLDGLDFAWPHDRELIRRALNDAGR